LDPTASREPPEPSFARPARAAASLFRCGGQQYPPPPSAFILYSQAMRTVASLKNPSYAFSEISRILGRMWKNLSPEPVYDAYVRAVLAAPTGLAGGRMPGDGRPAQSYRGSNESE
jgi:hypothetical protein